MVAFCIPYIPIAQQEYIQSQRHPTPSITSAVTQIPKPQHCYHCWRNLSFYNVIDGDVLLPIGICLIKLLEATPWVENPSVLNRRGLGGFCSGVEALFCGGSCGPHLKILQNCNRVELLLYTVQPLKLKSNIKMSLGNMKSSNHLCQHQLFAFSCGIFWEVYAARLGGEH